MVWKRVRPPFWKYKKEVFARISRTADFIYQLGESDSLKKPSIKVSKGKISSAEMQDKFGYIKNCLRKYRKLTGYGRGIAAVQVGIPERFAVIYIRQKPLIIINPKITRTSKTFLKYPEMCMSAMPIIAPIIRPAWVEFEYYDEKGILKYWNIKDDTTEGRMLNRVFQHEIDHINGIINIDLVKSAKDLILQSDPDFYSKAKFTPVK